MKRFLTASVVAVSLGLAAVSARAADIVETAVAADDFNTLVAAVQAAELAEVLQSPGPFTVFAPTDEAFAKLPDGTVENLLKPENREMLVAVLTYHVIPGQVMADQVVGQKVSVDTVEGSQVHVNGSSGTVYVNDAQVIATDIVADNGVIHVIDTVIMPPM
jgi:uncharacterized surface protein with fasciclin (FAS1) repeats